MIYNFYNNIFVFIKMCHARSEIINDNLKIKRYFECSLEETRKTIQIMRFSRCDRSLIFGCDMYVSHVSRIYDTKYTYFIYHAGTACIMMRVHHFKRICNIAKNTSHIA